MAWIFVKKKINHKWNQFRRICNNMRGWANNDSFILKSSIPLNLKHSQHKECDLKMNLSTCVYSSLAFQGSQGLWGGAGCSEIFGLGPSSIQTRQAGRLVVVSVPVWKHQALLKVQGFFICHIINYTGYNQKWNVNQIRSAQWTVQKNKNKNYIKVTQEHIYIYIYIYIEREINSKKCKTIRCAKTVYWDLIITDVLLFSPSRIN